MVSKSEQFGNVSTRIVYRLTLDMPTLLLITPHFPPSAASGSFRMLGFAKQLPALGWKVTVITCFEHPWEPSDSRLRDEVPPAVAVHGVPYPKSWRSRLMRSRFGRRTGLWDGGAAWAHAVRRLVKQIAGDEAPDVVLTSGPPHSVHMLGRRVKQATGAIWAADFRDPWVAGQWTSKKSTTLERRRERTIIDEADLVIANAPRAEAAYREHYPDSHKFTVVTNGYDPEPVPPRSRCNGSVRILHAGEIYAGRDPRPLLDALASSGAATGNTEVEFLGRTNGANLHDEAARRGIGNRVRVREHVSSDEAKHLMGEADALLLMDSPGRRIGVPAKLYEYIGSGRPIIALAETESDTAWVLKESGVQFALAPPRDSGAIALALESIVSQAQNPSMGPPPQSARFTRAEIARGLSEQLKRLLALRKNGSHREHRGPRE